MKRVLFQPFDIGKWFILGFTAWIASLADGASGGGGSATTGDDSAYSGIAEAGSWLQENWALVLLIAVAVLAIVAVVYIALLWVSSRGKFVFLDNVIHNRARLKSPWKKFKAQGNSLFWWRLVFALILFAGFAIAAGSGWMAYSILGENIWIAIIPAILVLLPIGLGIAYITTLLEDFVVPLMYKHSLSANQAWRKVLSMHRSSAMHFLIYALWKAVLYLGAFVCIMVLGVATLFIGFVFMAIPYLGAVLLLPMSVFFRFLGPEFLRQFGDEFDVMPKEEQVEVEVAP